MADDLQQLADWVEPLLRQLDPKQRRQLTRKLATDLRRRNQKRIRAQVAPDGTRWEPRKPQRLRGQSGFVKRGAMFTKLRTARYLRLASSPDSAAVQFLGRVAQIANVHHYGLRDEVSRHGPKVEYPARQLLGFAEADEEAIQDLLIDHLQQD